MEGAWNGGYKKPVAMGGGIFVPVALTPWGGWHRGGKEWTGRTAHSGDEAAYYSWDERFEHPVRTWASASHQSFTLQSVGIAMAKATYTWMERMSKDAMRGVLGVISEARRERG